MGGRGGVGGGGVGGLYLRFHDMGGREMYCILLKRRYMAKTSLAFKEDAPQI